MASVLSPTALVAADWNTWLGPRGDNTVRTSDGFDPDLGRWQVAWSSQVGRGYAAITTFRGRAYTSGHDEISRETIVCLDLVTGRRFWEHAFEAELIPRAHGGGPNASIAIEEGRLYAISKDGQLHCLDPDSGKLDWKVSLIELLDVELPTWGFGASPVIVEEQLIVSAGRVAALDKTNGDLLWASERKRRASYGTPAPFEYRNASYIAAMDGTGFAVLNNQGEELFHKPMVTKNNVISNTPMVFAEGRQIFIHTNAFSEVVTFDGRGIDLLWNDRKLQNSQSASVLVDGVLYGLNGLPENDRTKLYARDPHSGDVFWSVPNFGFGSLIAVDETLLILTDDGALVTASANTTVFRELSRKQLLEPTCWTKPIYAAGRILIRNDAGQVICLVTK